MTRIQAHTKARRIADALRQNGDDYHAGRISYEEHGRRNRALWASVEPQAGPPLVGRRYPVLNRVTNLICGRDIDYGFGAASEVA